MLQIPDPEASAQLRRIALMERNSILPLKAAAIAMLLYSYYSSPWIGRVLGALDIAIESVQFFLWVYIGVNLVFAVLFLRMRHLPIGLVQWVVFCSSLMDAIFLSTLLLITDGYESNLYWLYPALIVRSAVSVPRATSQLLLNVTLIACYVTAGLVYIAIADMSVELDDDTRLALGVSGPLPREPLLARLVLLFLMTVCAYGVQVLLERQRRAEEEAREFAFREGQLHAAGRLAAEFAHQIKNPLAIINTAAFSLDRELGRGNTDVGEQIQIIKEEVDHSDRIITEIMGYAQLSEGRVEKLDVLEELESAIARVFPRAAGFPIEIFRETEGPFPHLFMQRRHLTESLANVLQNAREALAGRPGKIWVRARHRPDRAIEISVTDNGPGIPEDKQERVFEAYYTTKEKGTGLGLATVKHNLELYGGSVKVESELGKGACFKLVFPARALGAGSAHSERS